MGSWPINGVAKPHTASKPDSTAPFGVSCSSNATYPASLAYTRGWARAENAEATGAIQFDVEQIGSMCWTVEIRAIVASNEVSISAKEHKSRPERLHVVRRGRRQLQRGQQPNHVTFADDTTLSSVRALQGRVQQPGLTAGKSHKLTFRVRVTASTHWVQPTFCVAAKSSQTWVSPSVATASRTPSTSLVRARADRERA